MILTTIGMTLLSKYKWKDTSAGSKRRFLLGTHSFLAYVDFNWTIFIELASLNSIFSIWRGEPGSNLISISANWILQGKRELSVGIFISTVTFTCSKALLHMYVHGQF